jgi:DNA-directed RNA polymerase subunit omega
LGVGSNFKNQLEDGDQQQHSAANDYNRELVTRDIPTFKSSGTLVKEARAIAILGANMIQRRSHSHFDSIQIAYRAEELIGAASNRYKITVQVANRAKKRHRYESDNIDDPSIKPVMRAIIEMSDELTQPEILGD